MSWFPSLDLFRNRAYRNMAIQMRSVGCVIAIVVVSALVLPPLVALPLIYFWQQPTLYRFSFPAGQPLTENDAVELSRRALILYGKQSGGMHPVPYWHDDERIFARSDLDPDSGYVLWWVSRPECEWEYSVDVTREGDEVVCAIVRPL